jgi:hypothetical protein
MSLKARLLGVISVVALVSSVAACAGNNAGSGNGDNYDEDFVPVAAVHDGQTYCVYPDGADATLFCDEMRDSAGNPIPSANWVEMDDAPTGFDQNREYGDNDVLELFLFMWLLGHMDFYDSPRFYNHYYHSDSARHSYQSKMRTHKSNYGTTITRVQSNPKYASYKSTNGKTYTVADLRKDKKFDRLGNDRVNNPNGGSATTAPGRGQTIAPTTGGKTTQPSAPKSTKSKSKSKTRK